ncbi:hypothetical protein FIBSPDRAFT_885816 [Athelia psychrophila]|uniref:Uncharacterized protein n=1 Tax=Athelia psychrophila TaxID=1759441 RepID=A0A166RFM1_9AGAM|nr:hypothetical protein FIBSPDRAFT_885816 [Fibularhizoctonia sp. CBS 109695]
MLLAPTNVELIAPPAEQVPDSWEYPAVSRYKLVCGERYLRGWVARAPYNTKSWANIKRRQVAVKTPPINIKLIDGRYTMQLIPGCIRAKPSISYCKALDGDPENTITIAASHTLKSLKEVLAPVHYTKFECTGIDYACNMWGCNTSDSRPAQVQIKEMLIQIAFMGTTVLEATLSRFESHVANFHMYNNNVMFFGDSGPSFTGIQINISSTIEDLTVAIGIIQADWHADQSDDCDYSTVCILLLRLPPGSDPGPFFLGQHGIYFYEPGVWILTMVFSGSHVQRGTAPWAPPPGLCLSRKFLMMYRKSGIRPDGRTEA